jgi:hypothetical protein
MGKVRDLPLGPGSRLGPEPPQRPDVEHIADRRPADRLRPLVGRRHFAGVTPWPKWNGPALRGAGPSRCVLPGGKYPSRITHPRLKLNNSISSSSTRRLSSRHGSVSRDPTRSSPGLREVRDEPPAFTSQAFAKPARSRRPRPRARWPPLRGCRAGFYSGAVGEFFLDAAKPDSSIDAFASDAAILISSLLQRGAPLDEIGHALRRDFSGAPASVIGAI